MKKSIWIRIYISIKRKVEMLNEFNGPEHDIVKYNYCHEKAISGNTMEEEFNTCLQWS